MLIHVFRLLAAFALVACTGAHASLVLFANLTNAQEAPITPGSPGNELTAGTGAPVPSAPRPASFGSAFFTLNDAGTALTFFAQIFNIDFTGTQTPGANDNLLNAHIHAAPALSATGTAPVVWGFFGAPLNDTIPSPPPPPLFDCIPFATGVGGTCTGTWDAPEGNGTTLTAQLPNILNGVAYINFHTTQFSGGEIRGFLRIVPEPGPIALVALGLALLTLQRRMQRS